jgi:alkylation response protein AidB-like acyl-CoA dehydrogenase
VEIVETWDALGMRSTGSHDVILHDVRVPHRYLIPPQVNVAPRDNKINAWFPLTVSAAYLGVALAAQATAVRYAKERVPTALGKPIAELESIQRHLGQAELLLRQARLHLYHTADLWDRFPEHRSELGPSIWVAKYTATNNAIAAVDHCMRVAGGVSMTKSLPLERYYRDVRGGLSHPMNDDQALVMLGKLAISNAD